MKPTILAPILAVALLTVLAVPARLAAQVGGTGVTNRIPIWTDSTTLGNSKLFQTGGMVGIGNASPAATLDVLGLSTKTPSAAAPMVLKVAGGFGGKFLSGGYGSAGAGGALQLASGIGGTASFILFPYLPRATGGTGAAILMTGGTGGKVEYPQSFVGGNGGSITLQPGAAGSGPDRQGHPGNVILAPTRGLVGIGTATPTSTLDVGAGGTTLADSWITRSSRRFKTNIQPLEGALEKVEHLQGVTYERKADRTRQIGVVAEDVEQVVPEVVSRDPKTKQVQGVDYSRLAALLIEAVKSQQVEIKHLKTQIELLTSNPVGQ